MSDAGHEWTKEHGIEIKNGGRVPADRAGQNRLGRMQHWLALIDGFLADSGLDLTPFVTLTIEDC